MFVDGDDGQVFIGKEDGEFIHFDYEFKFKFK